MAAKTDLPALSFPFKDPKFIFFTDFDGTITLQDSNDYMVRSKRQFLSNIADMLCKDGQHWVWR
jgi:hypothetical protein